MNDVKRTDRDSIKPSVRARSAESAATDSSRGFNWDLLSYFLRRRHKEAESSQKPLLAVTTTPLPHKRLAEQNWCPSASTVTP